MTDEVSNAGSPTAEPRFIPAGEGRTVWLGDVYTVKLDAQASAGGLTLIDVSVPPGSGPPLHVHADAAEVFYVLSGELDITVGDKSYRAGPGDTVYVPPNVPHQFRNNGLHTARQLLMYTPAGFEKFFLEAGQEATPGTLPPAFDPQDGPRVAELGVRHQMFYRGF
ncbi:quercetin 2,3-dioxygenase [Mesorhizobium amorphae]|uniref:quercetin 2,3-dioxygenase n=1 Tax=Mesorhizobium amorphae TaxID=71433 RepID=UPI001184AB75|nr:quercetin 2,3-dioxygenase [Mesorhizobium amorphae]